MNPTPSLRGGRGVAALLYFTRSDVMFGGSMVLTFAAIGVAFCGALLWMANLSVKKHGLVPSVA